MDDKIRKACFDLSVSLMWEKDSLTIDKVDSHIDELQKMTDKFIEISNFYLENIESLNGNKDLLVRAINYIDHVHAIPPLRGDYGWFENTLGALIEMACPNSRITKRQLEFLTDIENGLAYYRENIYEDN
jgi:hypothetical protein